MLFPKVKRLWESASESSRCLKFDFPGLRIGVAEYPKGPTGVTVFEFPDRVFGRVDVRGGAPGTSLTRALDMGFGKYVSAVVFAGGSAYGLEAVSGVASSLLDSGVGSQTLGKIAVVPGAVVFDFNGRDNAIHPDRELGEIALRGAREGEFPLGTRGAGAFVHCGSYFGKSFMERSGQGAAFLQIGETRIGVFTVVNARGVIMDRKGQIILGNRDPDSCLRTSVIDTLKRGRRTSDDSTQNSVTDCTTLTLVATNRWLNQDQLQRLAIETHSSLARAIQPFHTSRDGDTLFAVTTADCNTTKPTFADLSVYASELAWDAVLSSVPYSPASSRRE